MKTITTYEKHSTAFNVLQYGFSPIYEAYRIKHYPMRKVGEISTSSLRRLEKLVDRTPISLSDCSEHWFRVVHYVENPTAQLLLKILT